MDREPPAVLHRSIDQTASTLGPDGDSYKRLIDPLVSRWDKIVPEILAPTVHLPSTPFAMARFSLNALRPAASLARATFTGHRAQGLFAGMAAHSITPLEKPGTSAIGLVMAISGHAGGWPLPKGGSQKIADALASYLRSLGAVIETDAPVESIDSLPSARAVLFDTSPRQLVRIAGKRLPAAYQKRMTEFAYGPGIFKIDWALSAPIPWNYPECQQTATLHLGATLEEIAQGEADSWEGRHPKRPFVLLAQPSLFDETRAPAGCHTAWAYCHVPNGSTTDMTRIIEDQVERSAPGFRDVILARSTKNTVQMEQSNANLIGGDIAGGANNLQQILFRPIAALDPYRTPAGGLYICSASTPPGGGVHGMCGYNAARSALKHTFGR